MAVTRRDFLKSSVAASTAMAVGLPIGEAAAAAAGGGEEGWQWDKGACRFCGQMIAVLAPIEDADNQRMIDETATNMCKCAAAAMERPDAADGAARCWTFATLSLHASDEPQRAAMTALMISSPRARSIRSRLSVRPW